jgi:hypothetical protein
VTYQVGFRAKDGMVIASDRRELLEIGQGDEGTGSKINMVKKIQIDHTGRFAWCYAGGETGPFAAADIENELKNKSITSSDEIKTMLQECGNRSWNHARGPNSATTLLFLDGFAKTVWRAKLSPMTVVEQLEDCLFFAGQSYSNASFFPRHYRTDDMNISHLSTLAAYTVRMAEAMDPLLIAGLDIAAFTQSSGRFEFLDNDACAKTASLIDEKIGNLFRD